MRLVLATEDFAVSGRAFAGFPLIIQDDGWIAEPAHTFLWETLVERGSAESVRTWEKYGRSLFDYWAFLNANGLKWDAVPVPGQPSPLITYRTWSLNELKLDRNTVNQRLGLVVRFYQWALRRSLIASLPFTYREVRAARTPGLLAHVDGSAGFVAKPSVMLKVHKRTIKYVTTNQAAVCLEHLPNQTHRLMFEIMLRTGLRQSECRTFPEKYVFDPKSRRDIKPGNWMRVHLDPRDMDLKSAKPRTIDVPWSLMDSLWSYSVSVRPRRERRSGSKRPELFLTEAGDCYGTQALTKIFEALTTRCGIHVRPHMLRHAYGTYTLAHLRSSDSFMGDPLTYVRDRMGHSDVHTTLGYLHLLDELDASVALLHESEIDKLFE